jgi:hypothetical protein
VSNIDPTCGFRRYSITNETERPCDFAACGSDREERPARFAEDVDGEANEGVQSELGRR